MKKRIFASLGAFLLIAVLVSACLPAASATAAEEDWYATAKDGELLYTVDFAGDQYYTPKKDGGDPLITVDPTDSKKVTVNGGTNRTASWWGGYISCLPLNETTNYTVYFSAMREKRAAFGFYIDHVSSSTYGVYGYTDQVRIMKGTSSLPGHEYVKYAEKGYTVPDFGAEQEFAFEVCGVNQTYAVYIKTASGKYELIDKSEFGDAVFFGDHLGVYLYAYYTDMPTVISNMTIYRGLAFGDPTPVATEPETSKPKDDQTTKAPTPEKTTPKDDQTDKAPTPEKTTPKTDKAPEPEKKGCGSSVAYAAVAVVAVIGTAVVSKRK